MTRTLGLLASLAALLSFGCSGDDSPHDSGGLDSGSMDSGEADVVAVDVADAAVPDSAQGDTAGLDAGSCSRSALESSMTATLASVETDEDFALRLVRSDGIAFDAARGAVTMATSFRSASTSKMVTSAVILWAVDATEGFDLDSQPQDFVSSWDPAPGSPIASLTLTQLLSFTSGLVNAPLCLTAGMNFGGCIELILWQNRDAVPGAAYHYGPSHMQVAGAMAIAAGGYSDWQALFTAFQAATGLFPASTYDLPNTQNPRLAGGMHWTGEDFIEFLKALNRDDFLAPATRALMFTDQVGETPIDESPAFDALGYHWKYGLGTWLECPMASENCEGAEYFSSPGAYGAYPFLNSSREYVGFLSREGALGTYKNGYDVFDSVREVSQEWADCDSP